MKLFELPVVKLPDTGISVFPTKLSVLRMSWVIPDSPCSRWAHENGVSTVTVLIPGVKLELLTSITLPVDVTGHLGNANHKEET